MLNGLEYRKITRVYDFKIDKPRRGRLAWTSIHERQGPLSDVSRPVA